MGLFDRLLGRETRPGGCAAPSWSAFDSAERYERFLDLACRHLRDLGFELVLGDGVVEARRDGQTITCGLQNIAQRCAAMPERAWSAVIREHFASVTAVEQGNRELGALGRDLARARELVKVRVYPDDYADAAEKMLTWPVAPGLLGALCYDLPSTVCGVPVEHLAGWELEADDARAIGLDNLAREPIGRFEAVGTGTGFEFQVLSGESFFTASQLLRLGEIFHLAGPHGLLVAVPHRHALIVYPIVDAKVIHAVPTLAQITAGMHQKGPGSLSSNVYWWRGGALVHVPVAIEARRVAVAPPAEFTALLDELASGRPS